jgi:biotin carboxyl carrier protein
LLLSLLLAAGCQQAEQEESHEHREDSSHSAAADTVELSPAAQQNLGIRLRRLKAETFWRTIEIPAVVKDRPGISDRGVVAPVTGVVTKIFHYPGDTVPPGDPLFSMRLVSESLHASQLELFKASREIEIARDQQKRLTAVSQSGALPQARLIEVENQIRRLEATVQAYRQDLQSRGLSPERIAAVAEGDFVTEITVRAPREQPPEVREAAFAVDEHEQPIKDPAIPFSFELHELRVELGQQVSAGEVLCKLADHRSLVIEGQGFISDMPAVQEAAVQSTEIAIEYEGASQAQWPPLPERLHIHHVSNTINAESRTFAFYLPLVNQWRSYVHDEQPRLLWRFRPGDRLRLHLPVEKWELAFVLPREAIAHEGPETYVFRQSGNTFRRQAVPVLFEDRRHAVVPVDGPLREGQFVVETAAAAIERALQTQRRGPAAGVHVHADGTVHEAH